MQLQYYSNSNQNFWTTLSDSVTNSGVSHTVLVLLESAYIMKTLNSYHTCEENTRQDKVWRYQPFSCWRRRVRAKVHIRHQHSLRSLGGDGTQAVMVAEPREMIRMMQRTRCCSARKCIPLWKHEEDKRSMFVEGMGEPVSIRQSSIPSSVLKSPK